MHSLREDLSFNAVTADKNESWMQSGLKGGMRGKIAIALVVSVACAGYAASLTSTWLDDQRSRYEVSMVKEVAPAPVYKKIVVASTSVAHGQELTAKNTKVINWAGDELPPSAFKATDALFTGDGKRFALSAIEPNEPILSSKITAPGKSASLSAQLAPGKKAVTIRVDDVLGVAGLIVPNDRVDILWTSRPKGEDGSGKSKEPFTAMLIPGVRVLALDQSVKESSSRISVARAITIEVDTNQAQKVALGSQTGKLHLALRSHGTAQSQEATFQRVSLSNLGSSSSFFGGLKTVPVSTQAIKFDPKDVTASITPRKRFSKVTITRGFVKEEYDVIKTSSM